MRRQFKTKYTVSYLLTAFIVLIGPLTAFALSLDEAIKMAKEKLPSYKASIIKIQASENLYRASLSPYLPSIDLSTSNKKFFTNSEEYDTRSYSLTMGYTLFDAGKRKTNRQIARLSLEQDRQELERNTLELEFNVKNAFYRALAQLEILDQRRIALKNTEKDHEVAEGRYRLGVAKLSDVLQASVRLEQAKFNLIQAEGDYRKALSDLNSLIGKPLDSEYRLEGSLETDLREINLQRLIERTLERPEIKKYRLSEEIARSNLSLTMSEFYPKVSASASYTKTGGGGSRTFSPEEKSAGITIAWNIFELGKFYKKKASEAESRVSGETLNDIIRQASLDVTKSYQDFIIALSKVRVAEEQLKQAEQNYAQAFGEYKVGKGDILSLVQAESALANARQQLIDSKLNLILSKSTIERVAGIHRLEEFR